MGLLPLELFAETKQEGYEATLCKFFADFPDTQLLETFLAVVVRQRQKCISKAFQCDSADRPCFTQVRIDTAVEVGDGMNIHQVVLSAQGRLSG